MLDSFKRMVEAGCKEVTVSSGGGRESDALDVADLIQRNGIRLRISGKCSSSCAQYLLPAASGVTVEEGSIIAFHINTYGLQRYKNLSGIMDNNEELSSNIKKTNFLYKTSAVRTVLLFDAVVAVEPQCYRDQGGVGGTVFANYDLWVPSPAYMHSVGLKVSGKMPQEDSYLRIAKQYYKDSARIRYGPPPRGLAAADLRKCAS
jgi:hypothetical protein